MKSLPALTAAIILAPALSPARAQSSPTGSTVTLLALNQPPCTVPTPPNVLRVKVAYTLAASEQAGLGYQLSIKFQGTNQKMTFSKGRLGQTAVSARQDTLTITYPMSAIWEDKRLRRPVTCFIYLHRNTAPGRSTVIAKTPPIVFQECQ